MTASPPLEVLDVSFLVVKVLFEIAITNRINKDLIVPNFGPDNVKVIAMRICLIKLWSWFNFTRGHVIKFNLIVFLKICMYYHACN